MILNSELKITWTRRTKKWYISKGYTFTGYGDTFIAKIEDITDGCQEVVEVKCDGCNISLGQQRYGKVLDKRKARKSEFDYCQKCLGKMKKIDISEIRNRFIKKDYIPLFKDEDYENSDSKLAYKCSKHPEVVQYITTSNLHKCGCYYCGRESLENKHRYDEKFVFEQFNKKGLRVVDGEKYKNMDTPIKYICPLHPTKIQEITFYSLYFEGHGCRECSYDKYRRNEKSNFWKGGVDPISHKIRNSVDYKNWRISVFERDNYTCQCCGDNRGGNLQAHHIENFANNEDLRFDINNGITLCEECHNPNQIGSFHNIYGTYNNTKEQLIEYIQKYKNGEINEMRKQAI